MRFTQDNANIATVKCFILKASTGSTIFDGSKWLDTVIGAGQCSMLRRCVALGTDWLWLHHTYVTVVVNGPDTWHIWRARSSRQSGHCYLLQTVLAPRTPMGVATVTVFCIWTECSRFDRCSYFQSHLLKLFRTVWKRADWSGNLDWGAARSAAADTVPGAAAAAAAGEARMWCQKTDQKNKDSSLVKVICPLFVQQLLLFLSRAYLHLKVYLILHLIAYNVCVICRCQAPAAANL